MTFRFLRNSAVSVLSTMLLASSALAQSRPAEPASPYGGVTVEEIIARVNDQIITSSDYDQAMKELDDEMRQHGSTMQQISEAHKDLLEKLIDQQLWLSKGKQLGITGETELINRLNEIRKQYNLASMEDLQKAAEQQGVSYEDFKANIRNQIITRDVMRDEVASRISITPGEAERYFEEHKQEYSQPESVRLSEILVSTGTPGADGQDDPAKVAAAKAKADDIETKLRAGGDFAEIARTQSEGQTAAQGGDLGTYKRGQLAKVFEDDTFGLKTGEVTQPIRTRQGFVIFKVMQHIPGGVPAFKDVEQQVEQAYYESKMEPADRAYLTKMREDAYIEIKPGYVDSGASPNSRVLPISYAAYAPPAPKKKKKVERTRFRETPHFRRTTAAAPELANAPDKTKGKKQKKSKKEEAAAERPGKKEKIRFGKAPRKTLPSEPQGPTEDAGAVAQQAQAVEPENPLEPQAAPEHKTRFSDRARTEKKKKKVKGNVPAVDPYAQPAPDAADVADRATQSAPLGLGGNTAAKKKHQTSTGEKTRLSKKKKNQKDETPLTPTPIPQVQGAPAPAAAPATPAQPQQ